MGGTIMGKGDGEEMESQDLPSTLFIINVCYQLLAKQF